RLSVYWDIQTVDALVMRGSNVTGHLQECDAGELLQGGVERLGADFGVRLHDLKLPVAQSARLEKNAIGDSDLANVMQRAGLKEQADVLGVNGVAETIHAGQLLGEDSTVTADALQMRAGFRIARFSQLGHREDCHVTRFQRQDALTGTNAREQFRRIEWFAD